MMAQSQVSETSDTQIKTQPKVKGSEVLFKNRWREACAHFLPVTNGKKTFSFSVTCCTYRHVLCWPEVQSQGAVGVLLLLVH